MKYLEYSFEIMPFTDDASDILSASLGEIGFESFIVEGERLKAYVQKDIYKEGGVEDVVNDFLMPEVKINFEVSEPEDKDWNEEWEKNFFQPIVIEDRCVIHSSFHKDIPNCEYDILINPQMAFGTGHHETTSQIIGELLDTELKGKDVLDMGCGTSILAILARMRGAKHCRAIDIDDWCVRNSEDNIALNKLDGIDVMLGDAEKLSALDESYDVIIANINRNILLRDMKYYVGKLNLGGDILMSGFYEEDLPMIVAEGEKNGLEYVSHRTKNNWVACHLKQKS